MQATTKSFIWPCGQRSQYSFLYMKLSHILINIHTKYDKMCLQRDDTWKTETPEIPATCLDESSPHHLSLGVTIFYKQ